MENTFDTIMNTKGKVLVNVSFSSCMGGSGFATLRVVRRTTHKRGYWAQSITLGPVDGGKIRGFAVRIIKYKRDGSIHAATGDMAAKLHTLEIV